MYVSLLFLLLLHWGKYYEVTAQNALTEVTERCKLGSNNTVSNIWVGAIWPEIRMGINKFIMRLKKIIPGTHTHTQKPACVKAVEMKD